MALKTINDAITAHGAWMARFETAINGTSRERFDFDLARDHQACELGQWLQSPAARTVFDEESHAIVVSIHNQFHKLAGDVLLAHGDPNTIDVRPLLDEMHRTSDRLVNLLQLAKQATTAQ